MNLSEVPLIFHLSGKLCGVGIGSIVTGTSEASLENPRLSSLPSGCTGKNSNHSILPAFSLNIFILTKRVFFCGCGYPHSWIFNVDRIIECDRFSPIFGYPHELQTVFFFFSLTYAYMRSHTYVHKLKRISAFEKNTWPALV